MSFHSGPLRYVRLKGDLTHFQGKRSVHCPHHSFQSFSCWGTHGGRSLSLDSCIFKQEMQDSIHKANTAEWDVPQAGLDTRTYAPKALVDGERLAKWTQQ